MDLRAILKALKFKTVVPPQLKNDGALDGNTYIETTGLGGILFLFVTGTTDAALGSTTPATPPLIEECDTPDGSYAAIPSAALATVIGAGDDDTLRGVFVDLAKTHKKYARIQAPTVATGATGDNFCAIALGFPSDVMPQSAAEMGLAELVSA